MWEDIRWAGGIFTFVVRDKEIRLEDVVQIINLEIKYYYKESTNGLDWNRSGILMR